jgi:uncharacterized repeat protein (TIGR02543 family)
MVISLLPVTVFAADPPTLIDAAVTADGGVGLTFSKEMSPEGLVEKVMAGFAIVGENGTVTITNVTLHSASGGTNNFVQLYLSPAIKGGEVSSLSYTPGEVQSADGGMLAAIGSMDIVNYLPHPVLNTMEPPEGMADSAYAHTFTASGGTGPYTFSMDSGSLPTGLTMTPAGEVSGIPTVGGRFIFSIRAEDTNNAFDIEEYSIMINTIPVYVCEINGIGYTTLEEALAVVVSGETITILEDITYRNPIILNGKDITLNLAGHTVTVDTILTMYSTALTVSSGGKLRLFDDSGAFNILGSAYGVVVDGAGSMAQVTNAEGAGHYFDENSIGVYVTNQGSLNVSGNVSGSKYGALATEAGEIIIGGNVQATSPNSYESFGAGAKTGGTITIAGDVVSAKRGIYATDLNSRIFVQNVHVLGDEAYGIQVESMAQAFIGGNCVVDSLTGTGIFVSSHGEATIDGAIDTRGAYIRIETEIKDSNIIYRTIPTTKDGYHTYSTENGVVWVRTGAWLEYACQIEGGLQYYLLEDALASIAPGETKTITLLKNIDYDKGIVLDNKKITFALNGYTLNVVSSIEGVPGLAAYNGGCVDISGEGALNVTGPARSYGVTAVSNIIPSTVTVTNATAIGSEGKAVHAYNRAAVTVLGDVTATGTGSYGVHVQTKATVEVLGNIRATNQGVCVSDATLNVAGNIVADGEDFLGNPVGIGVNVYDGVAEIRGNVTANRVGAMIRAGGSITIDGTLTAPDYIQFNDDAPTTINGYILTTTKEGYRTYQTGINTVWMKGEILPAAYVLTVENGAGGGSFAENATVTISAATSPAGQRFKEWSISPSVTFTEGTSKNDTTAKFIMPAQAVSATAVFEAIPASTYTITVQNDGHGTASANFNTAAEGAEITLTAAPNSGYRFKEWQVISGGVVIEGNKFHMFDTDVVIKAIFEQVLVESYQVMINGSFAGNTGVGSSGAGTYTPGETVTISAGNRGSYTFNGWTSLDAITFANANSATTTFIMPANNVNITANWSYSGGHVGGGGTPGNGETPSNIPSGDSSSTPIIKTPEKKPNLPVTATATITATARVNGTATVSISDKVIKDAITRAQKEAKQKGSAENGDTENGNTENGNTENGNVGNNESDYGNAGYGISVELNITMPKGLTALTATLTQNSLQMLINAGVSSLKINGGAASLSLDLNALQEVEKQSGGNITMGFASATGISKEAQKLIGKRPVYNITIKTIKNSKTKNITKLGSGMATLSISYTPAKREATGYLFGVYVDGKGKATPIADSIYDVNKGKILISTNHFSIYGVGYMAPKTKFGDISTHWARESIEYIVSRGLLSGTKKTTFAPDTAITRETLVTALGKLAGVDTSLYSSNSFTDVKADSPSRPYIEWAGKEGIVTGTHNNQFAPDRPVTREEIALIFVNYAKVTGSTLPVVREGITFTDELNIGSSYKEAVKAMQQAGILMGRNDNKFEPKSGATRGEVSAMLHRYIKLTITPDTAQGWTQNDAGQYFYYKDGKVLTGWQTIEDIKYYFDNYGNRISGKWHQIEGKWYYFNINGSLAVSTTIEGFEVDEDGVRKSG